MSDNFNPALDVRPWYLATPYTNFPEGLDRAADFAAEQAALLMQAGHEVFSPIVHSHWIATAITEGSFDLTDGDFWLQRDAPFMRASRGMIFVKGPSWERSSGMLRELVWFTEQAQFGKSVVFMEPGVVPALPTPIQNVLADHVEQSRKQQEGNDAYRKAMRDAFIQRIPPGGIMEMPWVGHPPPAIGIGYPPVGIGMGHHNLGQAVDQPWRNYYDTVRQVGG